MARLPRYIAPNYPQHIIQRGINRQPIFIAEADYIFFHQAMVNASQSYGLQVHAYVWMPNHIHLLATPLSDDSISKVFQSAARRYAQYFNRTYERTGTIWDGRYRATMIDSKKYLLKIMQYIEANPLRSHLSQYPAHYHWSSYCANANGTKDDHNQWLSSHEEYLRLGANDAKRQEAYIALFEQGLSEVELALIRENSHKGWVLGSEQFKREIEFIARRRGSSKGVGRPKKHQ